MLSVYYLACYVNNISLNHKEVELFAYVIRRLLPDEVRTKLNMRNVRQELKKHHLGRMDGQTTRQISNKRTIMHANTHNYTHIHANKLMY